MDGLKNEDIWQLVRRFNKQVYHLKAVDGPVQGGIDLTIADKDEFTPDKLRSTLERLYMTIGLGIAAFFTHIARLRSWKEWKRSTLFFGVYMIAWIFDVLMPLFFGLITLLLASPRARKVLFPPAPLAAISAKTGEAKVPKSGQLGSDGLTGAAESYKGEAVEQEASNVVGSVAHLAVSTAIGNDTSKVQHYGEVKSAEEDEEDEEDDDKDSKNEDTEMENDEMTGLAGASVAKAEKEIPDPAMAALTSREAQSKAKGEKQHAGNQEDLTSAPVQKSIWAGAQPLLHALEDAADTWERFGNALSPTAPFSQHRPRLQIASIVASMMLFSLFISNHMVYKSTTLIVGLLFFGQPAMNRLKFSDFKKMLDEKIPDWPRYLELRNSILKGVPTDAQLTITLLRIGEANKRPLPPPPPAMNAPPPTAKEGQEMVKDVPPEYEQDLKEHQDQIEEGSNEREGGDRAAATSSEKPKKQSKLMAFLKGSTKAGTNTVLGTNRIKAEAGFEHARRKVGVVKKELSKEAVGDGPASFHARHRGKRGLVLISTSATTPCVSFEKQWPAHARAAHMAYEKAKESDNNGDRDEESATLRTLRETAEKARPTAHFSIQVDAIVSLRKLGGLGWKGKLVVGWALESEVADGIEIETRDGKKYFVTALPRRDELFNRLAAISKDHQWEAW